LVLAFLMRDSRPKHAAPRAAKRPNVDSSYTALDTSAPVLTTVPVDTLIPATPVVQVAPRATTASTGNVERVSAPPAEAPAPNSRDAIAPQAATRSVATRIGDDRPARPSAPASAKSRSSARWVNSVAKGWIVVRTDARKDARIVASIGPDTRVQLGELRGSWRRVRARGIAGWTDATAFAAIRSSTKPTGVAVR
jgi:hypothetical protein